MSFCCSGVQVGLKRNQGDTRLLYGGSPATCPFEAICTKPAVLTSPCVHQLVIGEGLGCCLFYLVSKSVRLRRFGRGSPCRTTGSPAPPPAFSLFPPFPRNRIAQVESPTTVNPQPEPIRVPRVNPKTPSIQTMPWRPLSWRLCRCAHG